MDNLNNYFVPSFSDQLLLKRKKIKRQLLERQVDWLDVKIAILGGSTTHDIKDVLELFLLYHGIRAVFYESEYNQYWQDVMFDNKELSSFKPDIIYIHTSNRNIMDYPVLSDSREAVDKRLHTIYKHFSDMWEKIEKKYGCIVIQNNFEYPYWRLQGNREATDYHGTVNFITRLNLLFAEYAQEHENFLINDINYLSAKYGLEKWFDLFYWCMYKYCLSMQAIPTLVHSVACIIKSLYGKNKKAFALDLDNTLWGGIVGDDGPENLKIGRETPTGEIYTEFQEYLKAHRQLGIILNIISKNENESVLAGLNHPDMTLRPDDFVMIKANWEPKSENLLDVAHTLSLTPDSFVFVDDNPAEREIIRQQIKNATVPDMGDNPKGFIGALDKMGYFEVTAVSADDASREKMYHENAVRAKEELRFSDYNEYLLSLKMKAEIGAFIPTYYSRIAQLSNKSNQFNLTTRRYTQAEIEAIATDDSYITLYGKLSDKFGDNGVVSVVIGHRSGETVDIDLWIMSCRVLKRDMECAMADKLVEECRRRGIKKIIGHFYPTAKNSMVKEFYGMQGFDKIGEDETGNSKWELALEGYELRNHVIELSSPSL
ncbi:MAG: HAD-IIIC family phosphatase [Lachnospiraceae bacterium]|jgi:FkbH-like protein|nr:HAD-IIIC family phosphatase [Lachnospiraceae bacterium]